MYLKQMELTDEYFLDIILYTNKCSVMCDLICYLLNTLALLSVFQPKQSAKMLRDRKDNCKTKV